MLIFETLFVFVPTFVVKVYRNNAFFCLITILIAFISSLFDLVHKNRISRALA
jgi:hypothetical protein